MEDFAAVHPEIGATDIAGVEEFCRREKIDFCVVTPDDPLVLGMVDVLEDAGIECFGPRKAAAMLEGSKSFAKEFMARHSIPTAAYQHFADFNAALEYARKSAYPLVIKADGLALGKGVAIVTDFSQAAQTLRDFMLDHKYGDSSASVVIEEFLTGPEISVLTFCDGKSIQPMVSSMDHKRIFDGDTGPNTGGMGVIAPNPVFTAEAAAEFAEKIMLPTLAGLQKDGLDFRGCLYFGLMLTKNGMKVIEYNARFGDPETQVVLPLLKGNLLEIFQAVSRAELSSKTIESDSRSAACVVMAGAGYPENPAKGNEISYSEKAADNIVFAGVKHGPAGKLLSNGGRVLNVLGFGETLRSAVDNAYENVREVKFAQSHYRTDIGAQALKIEAGK
ncbi:phosphoribosylamine--glycine ligase [Arcanobacterium hippocoleae]